MTSRQAITNLLKGDVYRKLVWSSAGVESPVIGWSAIPFKPTVARNPRPHLQAPAFCWTFLGMDLSSVSYTLLRTCVESQKHRQDNTTVQCIFRLQPFSRCAVLWTVDSIRHIASIIATPTQRPDMTTFAGFCYALAAQHSPGDFLILGICRKLPVPPELTSQPSPRDPACPAPLLSASAVWN